MPLKINLAETGFNAVLKPYQIHAMKYLWANPDGKSSKQVYDAVNETLNDGAISKASIINSLDALVDEGVLTYHKITGKGGPRRIYKPIHDESGYKRYIAETVLQILLKNFPEATRKEIQNRV